MDADVHVVTRGQPPPLERVETDYTAPILYTVPLPTCETARTLLSTHGLPERLHMGSEPDKIAPLRNFVRGLTRISI